MARENDTDLLPHERAAHYRKMADDTEAMGRAGTREFRDTCRQFALRWRKLADELESRAFREFEYAADELEERRHARASGNVISAADWAARRAARQP